MSSACQRLPQGRISLGSGRWDPQWKMLRVYTEDIVDWDLQSRTETLQMGQMYNLSKALPIPFPKNLGNTTAECRCGSLPPCWGMHKWEDNYRKWRRVGGSLRQVGLGKWEQSSLIVHISWWNEFKSLRDMAIIMENAYQSRMELWQPFPP